MTSVAVALVVLALIPFVRAAAQKPPAFPAILSLFANRSALLGWTHTNLTRLSLRPAQPASPCERLLRPEWGTLAVTFKQHNLSCVRFEKPTDSILTKHEVHSPPSAFASRAELYTACEGLCIARFERTTVVATNPAGLRFTFQAAGPLFMRLPPRADTVPWVVFFALVCGVAVFTLRPAQRRPSLLALVLVIAYFASLPIPVPPHTLSVRPGTHPASTVVVRGYTLHNFSRETLRAGRASCVLYTCNALIGVHNARFRTACDVVNFRAPMVTARDGRSVRLNWLKVLVGIWIVERERYSTVVYIDRDLVLTSDPLPKVGSVDHPMVFPDLGGGRPDSAMFVARSLPRGNRTNEAFLQSWLARESGQTGRRDGGEEQEALLHLFKGADSEAAVTMPGLYTFQCGRNAMNRAQCLQRRLLFEWNRDLFFAKVGVELLRATLAEAWPGRLVWMPSVALHKHVGNLGFRNLLICLVGVVEVLMYAYVFAPEGLREVKCSATAVKAISEGSFDNPFEGTLTAVYSGGIARRGRYGWDCFELGRFEERWSDHRLNEVQTFAVAQAAIVIGAGMIGIRHLLNPVQNVLLSAAKRD